MLEQNSQTSVALEKNKLNASQMFQMLENARTIEVPSDKVYPSPARALFLKFAKTADETYSEFRSRIIESGKKELDLLAQRFIESEDENSVVAQRIKFTYKRAASPELAKAVKQFTKKTKLKTPDLDLACVSDTVCADIAKATSTPVFGQYIKNLKKDLHVKLKPENADGEPTPVVQNLLKLYSAPGERERLIKKADEVRKAFPHAKMKRFDGLISAVYELESPTGAFVDLRTSETRLADSLKISKFLEENYSIKVQTPADIASLKKISPYILACLEQPQSIAAFKELKTLYPKEAERLSVVKNFTDESTGFYFKYASFVLDVGLTLTEANNSMKSIGLTLPQVTLRTGSDLTRDDHLHGTFYPRDFNMTAPMRNDFKRLLDPKIAAFVKEVIQKQYSYNQTNFGLNSIDSYQIMDTSRQAGRAEQLKEIFELQKKLNPNATFPLAGRSTPSKEILEAFVQAKDKLPKLRFNLVEGQIDGGSQRGSTYYKNNDERIAAFVKLHDALVQDFDVTTISSGVFGNLTRNADAQKFFFDPKKAELVRSIKKQYDLPSRELNSEEDYLTQAHQKSPVPIEMALDSQSQILLDERNSNLIKKFLPKNSTAKFSDRANEILYASAIIEKYPTAFSQLDELTSIPTATPLGLGKLILGIAGNLESTKGNLFVNEEQKRAYKEILPLIKELPKDSKVNRETLCWVAAGYLTKFPQANDALIKLMKAGVSISTPEEILAFSRLATSDAKSFINDEKFVSFMTKAFEKSGQKSSITTMDLPQLAALYKAVLKAPARENTLFSKQFSEMESFVKKEFFLDKIGFEGWISILDITETSTPKKLGAIIQELKKGGERPSANDLGLLATATVSSEAKAELMDRTTNLETLRKVYSRPPVVRRLSLDAYALTQEAKGYMGWDPDGSNQMKFENLQRLNDQIETIKLDELPSLLVKRDAEIKRIEEEGGLGSLANRRLVTERKISQSLANYTERPAAESLSRLDLARIGRVVSSLENSSFRAAIGKQLELDLEDTKGDDPNRVKTELGGTFDNFRQRLEVRPIESQSKSDGEYQPAIDARIHGGLLFHHFHAVAEDARKYAGPSGSVSTGGDFGVARDFNSAGIVMTPVGNAVDQEGKVIPGLRLINIDYFNPQGQTVDLGVYEVPVSDLQVSEVLSSRYIPRSTETMSVVK